jgi:hypothetical protein
MEVHEVLAFHSPIDRKAMQVSYRFRAPWHFATSSQQPQSYSQLGRHFVLHLTTFLCLPVSQFLSWIAVQESE